MLFRSKGNWFYEIVDNGYKYNTTDMNSALGIAQLNKLDWMSEQRKRVAEQYMALFNDTSISTLFIPEHVESSWHLFVIKVDNRDELYKKLKENHIGSSVHFIPIHYHPYYKEKYGYKMEDYPVANRVFEQSLSLPIFPE